MDQFNRKTAASENLQDKFLILWQRHENELSTWFIVLEIEGVEISPNPGLFFRDTNGDEIRDIDEADPFMDGNVKWDGCSNWSFHDQNCMMHMCGYRDAQKFARLIPRMYEIARDNMPRFDHECADMEPANPSKGGDLSFTAVTGAGARE